MDPIYKNMQSYPYQKDQLHYGPHYYPGSEAVPMPMYVNPVRPPINHQCWPWGSNYGYVPPVPCHGCCNHTYFPNHYAWGSPYSYVPPVHCPGTYPPFPVQYAPPPSYSMEQPRYEYEKTVPGDHHCCGCPNHTSNQKQQKNVRIEEEEPDGERRKNDSLVPFQLKNKPHHIVWLPPDYSNNREHGKVNNSEGLKDGSLDVQPHDNGKTVKQQPALGNGWYPVDLNNLVSSKPREMEKETTLSKIMAEQHENEGNKVNGVNMRQSLGSQKSSGGEQNSIISGDKIGGQSSPRAKDIPVREVKQQEDKDISSNKDKERDASMKGTTDNGAVKLDNGAVKLDNGEKKDPKDGAKRKSTSPPKSPKLPPVCLRVDPLPRRKSANGSSRSPSPPSDKQNPDKPSNKTSKAHDPSESKEPDNIHQDEFKKDKGQKTIEVVDGKISHGKSTDTNMETPIVVPPKSEEISINKREEKPEEENIYQKQAETDAAVAKGHTEDAESARGKNEESFRIEEVGANEIKESSKTKLTEEEAAVIIQSAYRGFDIRRWEPIKKLKQIAKVREQIDEVKHLIQAMESSPDSQGHSKQRNIIAETIMSLLLKLDMVQGLHPSIREGRKSVVRELVSLQEKLDSLKNESENTSGQESVTRREGDALNKTDKVISFQNAEENPSHLLEVQQLDRGSNFENLPSFMATPTAHPSDLLEAQEIQLDRGSNNENLQSFEATPTGEEQCEKEKEAAESVSELTIEGEDEMSNEVHQNGEEQCEKEKEAAESVSELTMEGEDEKSIEVHQNGVSSVEEADELGQGSELPLLQNESSSPATDFVPVHDEKLESVSTELPLEVFDEGKNHREIDAEMSNVGDLKQPAEGLVKEHIAPELHEDTAGEENKEHIASESHEDTAGAHRTSQYIESSPSEVNVQLDAEETSPTNEPLNNCKLDSNSGTEEEVDDKAGDALHEADRGAVLPPENVNAVMCKSPEASDTERVLTTESFKEEVATCNMSLDDFESDTKTLSEEVLDAPPENETPDQLSQEGSSQQHVSPIHESVNICEAADITEVKEAAEFKSKVDKAGSGECSAQQTEGREGINEHEGQTTEACQEENKTALDSTAMEASTKEGREDIMEQSLPPKDLEEQGLEDAIDNEEQNTTHDGTDVALDGAKGMPITQVDSNLRQVSPAKDELTESNKKLIEENERLRDMMQKLIKSGEEQLTAISSLSGRVKDLERRLSRKKKLKLKQCKAPRSSISVDGSAKQRTLGVAM
ncbi:UNVERIFIED_CONTAM: BAG family molecular chaperone regulator 6 [Sesamum latifolium]|uniref:BAG family molecular chaperone regulator 6 n=1 Tax=Sesamum latifolium TaxID=2727402 RepID=A0AAW2U932_9LAMI